MFNKVFIEDAVKDNKYAQNILSKIKAKEIVTIDNYTSIFGKSHKPYLQKRTNLNLFIAQKKGHLLKEAPDAYGLSGEPHFYFVHAYNCIYECTYCYLQGYFNSPDIVLFVNHDEILQEIENKINENSGPIWFHAGEFSDSLALSHMTGELSDYHQLFTKYPNAYLELRTKSVNTREIEKLSPQNNIIISFSLSSQNKTQKHDLKTAPLKARLNAIKKLHSLGHPIGIHLDPIIYSENMLSEYEELLLNLRASIPLEKIEYISVGVVRFTKDVFSHVKKNYPDAEYFYSELTSGQDSKIKYPRPMRMWVLNRIRDLCLKYGAREETLYLCMED